MRRCVDVLLLFLVALLAACAEAPPPATAEPAGGTGASSSATPGSSTGSTTSSSTASSGTSSSAGGSTGTGGSAFGGIVGGLFGHSSAAAGTAGAVGSTPPAPPRPAPAPAPAPATAAATAPSPPPPAPAPEAAHVVQVYFGTDRNVANTAGTVAFGTRRGAGITYGTVRVSVPPGHKLGEIELPHLPLMHPDERHHFVLQGITPFADARQFFAEIRRLNRKTAFVFVHGYNVSFHDAALRTAQLSVDLDVGAVPTFYSWPSQAALQKYPVDSEMAEWTEANLRTFLAGYARDSGVEAIVLIAHSMGSRPATRALATLMQQEPALAARYRMLVLAAPDIDADVFRRDLLPVYVRLNKPVTLYASSNDRALAASRRFNGAQRAGDSRPLPTLAPGLETVDASNVDTDFLGHSYIAESRVLLTDLALLIGRGLAAKDRPGLAPVQSGEAQFWQFRR